MPDSTDIFGQSLLLVLPGAMGVESWTDSGGCEGQGHDLCPCRRQRRVRGSLQGYAGSAGTHVGYYIRILDL